MDGNNKALYDSLVKDGYYTKSYEEFNAQFASHEKAMALFSAMQKDGNYTKTADDFKKSFFTLPGTDKAEQEATPTNIKIRDTRQIDQLSGQPLKDTAKFHANPDVNYIKQVVATARKHGVDPYTALAVNLAETKFDPEKMDNPFMLGNYDPQSDPVEQGVKFLANTLATAKKMGKTNEADQLQMWNGTGKIAGKGIMYGIDTDKTPIDMSKTPLYGKRVIDLRDNVLKKNPDFTKVVDDVMATNPDKDIDYYK
jgi:hypothetical protein